MNCAPLSCPVKSKPVEPGIGKAEIDTRRVRAKSLRPSPNKVLVGKAERTTAFQGVANRGFDLAATVKGVAREGGFSGLSLKSRACDWTTS